MSHSHEHAHAHDHSKDAKVYTAVLVALLILTVITVSASKIQFGSGTVNVVVALVIATVKASLVSLFFMHLLHDKPVNAIILVTSFMFLGIFLGSCYTDISTRETNIPSGLKSAKPIPVPTTGVGVIDPTAPSVQPAGEQPAGKAPVQADPAHH